MGLIWIVGAVWAVVAFVAYAICAASSDYDDDIP